MEDVYLIYLDGYHLGDPLFLKNMAQELARAEPGAVPCLIVHGSGEKVERTLESQGYFPERRAGVLQVETPEQRRLVERGVREANQELVALFTDEVVSTVGVQGTDRGLFQLQEDGRVTAGTVGWVEDLVKMRVVPVVSALAEKDGRAEEVSASRVVAVLARALTRLEPTVVFFTRDGQAGLIGGEGPEAEVPATDLSDEEDALPEAEAVQRVAAAGLPVLVTNLQGLLEEGGLQGTWVTGS